jgi:hypothetical protein
MDRKKIVERAFLDAARKLSTDIPTGEPVAGEEPDFVWPDHDLGLDVTEIRQPRSHDGFEPAQIESFRTKVARAAEREYRGVSGHDVDVTLSFVTGPQEQRNAPHLGKEVASFVVSHRPENGKTRTHTHGRDGGFLPEGLRTITISPPHPGRSPLWQSMQPGNTILLTCDMLAEALASKESKVASYRKRASKVWLLVVCGMFPGSSSIMVPDEAAVGWRFAHSFDRVLLFSQQDQKIWEIAAGVS